MEKCPFCGARTFGEVPPGKGTSFFLTELDQRNGTTTALPQSGLPVKVMGCVTCKKSILVIPSLSIPKP